MHANECDWNLPTVSDQLGRLIDNDENLRKLVRDSEGRSPNVRVRSIEVVRECVRGVVSDDTDAIVSLACPAGSEDIFDEECVPRHQDRGGWTPRTPG